MIRAVNVTKIYDNGVTALDNLNLEIKKGEFVFLVGTSGAGKTTLLKLLHGSEHISTGSLVVGNIVMEQATSKMIRDLRRRTSIVFQDFKLIPGRSALENVALSLRVLGKTSVLKQLSLQALEEVGLPEKANQPVESLSWGERQRVTFARALVRKPDLFLADEPTGNLDDKTSALIGDLLGKIQNRGATVIVVTHDLQMVKELKKRVIVLDRGKLVDDHPEQKAY